MIPVTNGAMVTTNCMEVQFCVPTGVPKLKVPIQQKVMLS